MTEHEPNPNTPEGLIYVQSLTWQEVKQSWKNDEDSTSFKREYAEHGYETWESWRNIIIEPLHLTQLEWAMYDIEDPELTVPHFRGGPFKPWQDQYYGGKSQPTFDEIVAGDGTDIATRDKFASIVTATKPVQLIGLRRGRDVFIIEGMHRSTSIALAASRNQKIHAPVGLLLATTDLDDFEIIA